jgi:predicted nucleotidyltransferase
VNKAIIEVWKYLSENKVNYLTIGGLAVNIYGYGRNTGDIDIYIEDTIANRENLRIAIKQMGLGDFESINTMQFIPDWTDFTLNFNFRLDIMTSVLGLENKSFKELIEKANIIEIENIPVYFIDYDNLLISKKSANRPKDILDVEELEKINKIKNQ